ncbi:MAG TPA: hypothetical protein PLR60_04730 [Syntrophorhabdaceae bacterium]|nr:hypothetical protein [Syntrophorhabdaceae bacterium]
MKYFLVSNLAECLLYLKEYAGNCTPFVLNVHDFRYFDVRGIPFVTIGSFMAPQQTREFCGGYLDFLRRFVDEMDTRNAGMARALFGVDIRLFSAIAYEIFNAFYGVFRFAACIHLMRTDTACKMVVPFNSGDSEGAEIDRHGLAGSFDNDDEVFKETFNYFNDVNNISVEKVFYTSDKRPLSRHRKQGAKELIRSSARKIHNIYASFASEKDKFGKYVLNMSMDDLWPQVLNSVGGGSVGVISIGDALSSDGKGPVVGFHEGSARSELFRMDDLQDEFMSYFRCRELIQDLLFQRYEELLQKTVPVCRAIKNYLEKNRICAVVGNACGATFMNSFASQLARQENIPVVGMQHGGQYGYMDFFDKLGYSDYYACDHWFSWGFDNAYFENVFHCEGQARAEIVPVGSVEISSLKRTINRSRKKRMPIVYPIVNNIKLTWSTFRTDDLKLYNFQKRILEKLFDSGREVLVKPHSAYSLALDDMLAKAPGNISISTEPLAKIFGRYDFEWVVIDLLSTPFEQACVSQAQILAFNDSEIWPIEFRARQMMEKRAWVFDDEENFLSMLDGILAGKEFEKRSDDVFEKNFILPYGEGTDRKALTELERIISARGC